MRITKNLENTLVALEALKANRLRTFLTLLGIIIGVASVIMVGAAVKSGQTIIFQELETFGLRSLWVYRSFYDDRPGRRKIHGNAIDNDDLYAIKKNARLINRFTPVKTEWNLWAKQSNNYLKIKLLAVDTDYAAINNDLITSGRFLMPDDLKYRRSVCIIGIQVVNKLFGGEDPLGREVRVGNNKYTVIGILKEKDRGFLSSIGSVGGQDANNRVIIPLTTYQRHYNTKRIDHIQAEAVDVSSAKAAVEEIKTILDRRHKGKFLYDSQTMQQYIETAGNILTSVAWIGGVAAAVSLVVGGIGIMNIMTVSVVERTREIGLRKAMGARSSDILIQFLSESVFISLLGGAIGTGAGTGLIWIIQILSHKPKLLAPEYVVVALTVSMLTGIFSGIYPARRAASLDPVEALRYE